MSPEQARGEQLDPTTDLFSFGAVLYEMATGERPFQGSTTALVFHAILSQLPVSPVELRSDLPRELDHIINKALEKDRQARYQHASEIRADLTRLKRDTESGRAAMLSKSVIRPRRRRQILIGVFGILALLSVAWVVRLSVPANDAAPLQNFKFTRLTANGNVAEAAIALDGQYVAYTTRERGSGKETLWIKQVSSGSEIQIAPPAYTYYSELRFSKDGNLIYYVGWPFNTGEPAFFKIPVLGGIARKVIDSVSEFALSPEGGQVAFIKQLPNDQAALIISKLDGSDARELKRVHKTRAPGNLAWSPDSKLLAFSSSHLDADQAFGTLFALPVSGGPEKPIGNHPWGIGTIAWMPSGHGLLLTAVTTAIESPQFWYVPYPTGAPQRITNDLNGYPYGFSATSDMRTLATHRPNPNSNIWNVPLSRPEAAKPISSAPRPYGQVFTTLPDGRIVFSSSLETGQMELWVMTPDGSKPVRLTNTPDAIMPKASPDGRFIAFSHLRDGKRHIWRVDADGDNPRQLTRGGGEVYPTVSSDSKWVVYSARYGVWKVPAEGGDPVRIAETDQVEFLPPPAVSPDGKLVAFWADRVGTVSLPHSSIVLVPFRGGPPQTVIPHGSPDVQWTVDGNSLLYYVDARTNIWVHQIANGSDAPVTRFNDGGWILWFALSADGKSLLCHRDLSTDDVFLIHVGN